MLKLRRSQERGHASHGWLSSHHTFSFASYYDPAHMGFGPLRVINEDRIDGGSGFGRHPHQDMEIISYVVDGALAHQDSMGNKAIIRPGEVQRMSAGTGVFHAEMNYEEDKVTHFFQIWITPNKRAVKPSYGQKDFSEALEREGLVLVVSPDGRDGSISMNQDADVYLARLKAGSSLHFGLKKERGLWLQLVKGRVELQGEIMSAGDGAAITNENVLELIGQSDAEIILFDLPMDEGA